nr:putative reverse transcriptase domain-containing protein [Tanacetum cinerariifolium]
MSHAAIRKLVADSVATALQTQTPTMAEADNPIRNTRPVFSRSNCTEENKVAFATGTLTNDALSWGNVYAQPIRIEQANRITWTKLKRLLKISIRFQELAVLCPNMVPNNEKLMEVFIGGLPRSIEGNVTASKPQTLEEAINIAQRTYLLRDKNAHQDPNVVTDEKQLENIPIVKEFPDIFPEELPGLPPVRQVEFQIELTLGATPVARVPYRLAPSEMQELSNQLQELAD